MASTEPDSELTDDEKEKYRKLSKGGQDYTQSWLFEQQCLLRKRLNQISRLTGDLVKSGDTLEKVAKRTKFFNIIVVAITTIALLVAIVVGGFSVQGVAIAQRTFEEANSPPFIVLEITAKRGNIIRADYLFGGPPDARSDEVIVNIWNVGNTVAQNVTVEFIFEPQNASTSDIHGRSICRRDVCSPFEKTIRALEPNGFVSVNVSLTVFPKNIGNSDLYLNVIVINPDPRGPQEIPSRFLLIVN